MKKPKIKTVLVFSNLNIAVCDDDGTQISPATDADIVLGEILPEYTFSMTPAGEKVAREYRASLPNIAGQPRPLGAVGCDGLLGDRGKTPRENNPHKVAK